MKIQPENDWYVLYVLSRNEKKVYKRLLESRIESFLPIVTRVHKWSDRKKKVEVPLFPSYVFVKINSPREFQKALSIDGACAYIRFGKEYAKAKEKEIQKIKFLIENKTITDVEVNVPLPKVGEIKKIICGPLKGLECEVLKVNNVNKVVVRIDSLKQNITASIPSNYFEKEAKEMIAAHSI